MPEIFTRLVGFEHKYEISMDGTVRSVPGITADGRFSAGRIVIASISGPGTRSVALERADGTRVTRQVARLVLETYYKPAPGPEYQARHKDGNRANNSLGNLEWAKAKGKRFWDEVDSRYARSRAAKRRRPVMHVTKREEKYDPPGW